MCVCVCNNTVTKRPCRTSQLPVYIHNTHTRKIKHLCTHHKKERKRQIEHRHTRRGRYTWKVLWLYRVCPSVRHDREAAQLFLQLSPSRIAHIRIIYKRKKKKRIYIQSCVKIYNKSKTIHIYIHRLVMYQLIGS